MSTLFEQLLYTTLRIECKDNDGNFTISFGEWR